MNKIPRLIFVGASVLDDLTYNCCTYAKIHYCVRLFGRWVLYKLFWSVFLLNCLFIFRMQYNIFWWITQCWCTILYSSSEHSELEWGSLKKKIKETILSIYLYPDYQQDEPVLSSVEVWRLISLSWKIEGSRFVVDTLNLCSFAYGDILL